MPTCPYSTRTHSTDTYAPPPPSPASPSSPSPPPPRRSIKRELELPALEEHEPAHKKIHFDLNEDDEIEEEPEEPSDLLETERAYGSDADYDVERTCLECHKIGFNTRTRKNFYFAEDNDGYVCRDCIETEDEFSE